MRVGCVQGTHACHDQASPHVRSLDAYIQDLAEMVQRCNGLHILWTEQLQLRLEQVRDVKNKVRMMGCGCKHSHGPAQHAWLCLQCLHSRPKIQERCTFATAAPSCGASTCWPTDDPEGLLGTPGELGPVASDIGYAWLGCLTQGAILKQAPYAVSRYALQTTRWQCR